MIVADRTNYPMGRRGFSIWDNHKRDTKFLDSGYFKDYGAWHPGEDWNDKRGGNSDWGAPVFAVANGVIEARGHYPVWGNILLIKHILPDGRPFWSQYAHLMYINNELQVGDQVLIDEVVGSVGRGENNKFYAHLHWEIRTKSKSANYWPGANKQVVLDAYTAPLEFVDRYRNGV